MYWYALGRVLQLVPSVIQLLALVRAPDDRQLFFEFLRALSVNGDHFTVGVTQHYGKRLLIHEVTDQFGQVVRISLKIVHAFGEGLPLLPELIPQRIEFSF